MMQEVLHATGLSRSADLHTSKFLIIWKQVLQRDAGLGVVMQRVRCRLGLGCSAVPV